MTSSWVDAYFGRVVSKQVSERVSYSNKTSRKEKSHLGKDAGGRVLGSGSGEQL